MWNIGSTIITRSVSCRWTRCTKASPPVRKFAWLCMAPLGNPVVPEV